MCPFNFISVGIDIGADFSWMSILTPDHKPIAKPFKILHSNLDSLVRAVLKIRKAEESYSMKARIFLESTGIYHFPLFCYLKESGFEVFVLNPLVTNSNRNFGIRKVKNDRFDSIRIAKTGYTHDLKVSLVPSDIVLNLRLLVREYYNLVDNRTAYVNRLHKELRTVFPGYIDVFTKITAKTSLKILKTYKTPEEILSVPKDDVIELIASTSRRKLDYALEKYNKLIEAAELSKYYGTHLKSAFELIQMNIEFIEFYNAKIELILQDINKYISKYKEHNFIKQIHLLDSINGIGLISAVTLMCEIGDFSAFTRPGQLYAYFGLDPKVKESGKFKGTKTPMSKRGSRIARRVLFIIALTSVRTSRNGQAINPILKDYYDKKKQSKPKMVAIGAVMHKVSNIIFAVLRDNKPFVLKTPEEHCRAYGSNAPLAA
jgi:transposase